MAIPDYQTLMLPLLRLAGDRKEHRLRDVVERLTAEFGLTEQEQAELLPSGRQPIFYNRAGWARTYLAKAGLLEMPKRGYLVITDRGREVLASPPERITNSFLSQFQEFNEFQARKKKPDDKGQDVAETEDADATPEESLELAYQQLRDQLAQTLLEKVKECSPLFFERLVVELLVAMGYGGSRKDAGQNVGKSGDGGIDGIIKEDRLGLDVVYLQAKRWENRVGRPEVQKFVGALQGRRARKGVFITTSDYSGEAQEYAANLDSKVVLIDGQQLAQLMIDFDLGVSRAAQYDVKRIDTDYFEED